MLSGGSMQQTKKNQGFTLIELMVTVAVMAIIAMMAAPSFNSQIYNYELKKEFNELVLVLNEARAKSKSLNQTISVFFRAPDLNKDPKNSLYLDADEKKYEFNMDGKVILFRSNGIVDPSLESFPLCFEIKHKKSGKFKKVELNQLGMQQISDGVCVGVGS